ncbi:MAG: hypothetical protein RLZZ158_2144 [Cyanobacteriota bacterium]|jgi:hypothetical protein
MLTKLMMRDDCRQMRTTLRLDHDILAAAKLLKPQRREPIGSMIRPWARQALAAVQAQASKGPSLLRNGLPLLPIQPGGAALELIAAPS